MNVKLESQAILFFSSEIRRLKRECEYAPISLFWIAETLNEAPSEVIRYLKKRYSPFTTFFLGHSAVFYVGEGFSLSSVDVVSKPLCDCYLINLNRKKQKTRGDRRETESDIIVEERAILHFSSILRPLSTKKSAPITKAYFPFLLNECPTDIKTFVETKYASLTPLESFEKFIKVHEEIFRESKSKKSVYVEPDLKVLQYIAKLEIEQLLISDEDEKSESSDEDESASSDEEEPLDEDDSSDEDKHSLGFDQREAVFYFASKMKELKQECTPISSIEEWRKKFFDVRDTVGQRYDGSFKSFMERHVEVFLESDNGQYETVSEEQLLDYLAGSNGSVTEQEKSTVASFWGLINSLNNENDASYSSLRDFYHVCCDLYIAVEDYPNVEDFLDVHEKVFKKSISGISYTVASMEEIEDYLFN